MAAKSVSDSPAPIAVDRALVRVSTTDCATRGTVSSLPTRAAAAAYAGTPGVTDHVTPVAVVAPSGQGTTTVGVVPSAFRRIALWPGVDVGSLAWNRLTAPTAPPLVLTTAQADSFLAAFPAILQAAKDAQ